jgi:branched-chain amino acid transport system permease protein
VRAPTFSLIAAIVGVAVYAAALLIENDYVFFAGYVVLQFIVLGTAWNILGGYCGYVNFGTAGFFAIGAYTSVAVHKLWQTWEFLPISLPLLIVLAGVMAGLLGLGVGYLTLRLRGVYFAIATLALAIVLQTLVINWDFVGGSRGAYIIRPTELEVLGLKLPYIQYLFLLMLALAVIAIIAARTIERSRLGYGFATIRDDELAAEACGVPTLRLKLVATTISGAFMGMAGATFPYYIGYIEPASAFGLQYAVNAIAMPMIGGTISWIGPLIGAILLGTLQQIATVTISSAVNLLLVGILLVDFVIIAPNGIVGLIRERRVVTSNFSQEPIGFVLLYALNAAPVYFLSDQTRSALPLEIIFWALLAWVAFMRGRYIGRSWLVFMPLVAAVIKALMVLGVIPIDPGTAGGRAVTTVLHLITLAGGLLVASRLATSERAR